MERAFGAYREDQGTVQAKFIRDISDKRNQIGGVSLELCHNCIRQKRRDEAWMLSPVSFYLIIAIDGGVLFGYRCPTFICE
jgi:hypothetical protein